MAKKVVKNKDLSCDYCGKGGCGCTQGYKGIMFVKGLIFLVVGYLLWNSQISLEQTIAVLIMIWGAKKLIMSFVSKKAYKM
ncbi:MAG: hypothetical protein QGF74_02530 [Candidatus Nanoarchaeia archaeon]|jgi:hypothetical protein|nr:hypothetical protein [Candidatus Nanoarchaeia archaeon]|tara:strand:+ start:5884 stop:6126 length:243 start_codon:yes stop_codon:yes gene_type:complete